MSKAKELAMIVLDNIEAGRSEWQEFRKSVWDLCEAVLSEPEPEPLRGWIEVEQQGIKITINVNKVSYFYDGCIHFYGEDRMLVKESYDSIKQKIKEAE